MTSSGAISSASIVSMAPDQAEDWGPGPPSNYYSDHGPPPEFRIPPPPLPSFMLPDDLVEYEDICQTTSLDSHFDVCDTTFPSIIKSTSGHFPLNSNSILRHWIALILGIGALFFLTLCLAIFLTWRRWRGRNRLSYLRTKSSYDSQRETSEHPLIYDDANIHFYRTHGSSNTYLIDGGRSRPIVRDLSGLSQQTTSEYSCHQAPPPAPFFNSLGQSSSLSRYDNESRIYEEVFLTSNREDNYAGATGTGNGLYAKPLEDVDDEANAQAQQPLPPSSANSRLIFCRNGSDSDQWHHPNNNSDDLQSGYSAVYVANSNNLAESSFSTSSTSDHQARSCSRGHSSISSGPVVTRLQSRQPPHQPQYTISSSSSSNSEDNNCSLRLQNFKENRGSRTTTSVGPPDTTTTSVWRPTPMAAFGGGQRISNNNLSGGCFWPSPLQPQPTLNQQHIVEQKKDSGGLLSSLWRKRSRTHDNKNLRPLQQQQKQQPKPHSQQPVASMTMGAPDASTNQSWMTLRVPASHMLHQSVDPRLNRRLQMPPTSRTLGRNYSTISNNHSNNGNHNIVMPNPDDILPKEAWTDFSGTDAWPRFSGIRRRSASDNDDIAGQEMEAAATTSEKSKKLRQKPPPPNYVNCQPDHCQKEDNSDNRVCPQQQQQPLLNGLQPLASESNNNVGLNGGCSSSLQQIENNLMEDNVNVNAVTTKNQNDIWQPRQKQRQPPQPPKRLQQQQSNLRGAGGKDQRNATATTKQKEQNKLKEEINGTSSSSTTAFLMDQHYHDDTTAMASNEDGPTPNSVGLYCTSEAEDEESDNEIQERSPLFKPPSERLQWQDSPLQ